MSLAAAAINLFLDYPFSSTFVSITATKADDRSIRGLKAFSSETEYADPGAYFGHRLEIIESWGPRLTCGDHLLQLGCGDGFLAELLVSKGYSVCATDASQILLDKTIARNRHHGDLGAFETRLLDINHIPFDLDRQFDHVIAVMRCFYKYATDPPSTFREVYRICRKKFITDFTPRRISRREVVRQMTDAGFRNVRVRAFLVPQKRALPPLVQRLLILFERSHGVNSLLTKRKFHLWAVGEK